MVKQSYFLFIATVGMMLSSNLYGQTAQTFIEAGCMISAPGQLKYFPKTVQTGLGEMVLHQYNLKYEADRHFIKFTLQYTDYPVGTIHHDSLELLQEFFEETATSSASAVLGKVDYSSEIDMDGYPGLIWRVTFDKEKGIIKSKAFVRNNRYFNLKVEYPKTASGDLSIDQFLNSFRWLEE